MVPAAVGFAGIALYTRLLDPGSFGTYAVLLSTAFLVGITGFSWLRIATLRMIATVEASQEPDFTATIAWSFAGTSIVVAAAIFLTLRIYQPTLSLTSEILTAAAAIASGWFELNVTVSQARLKLITMSGLAMARATGTLGFSLAFIALGLKSNALLGGFVMGNSLSLGALWLWRPAVRGRFSREIFLRMIRFGWPSSAGSLNLFAITFQRYLLAAVGGSSVLGVYAAASDFSQQTVGLLIGTATLAGQPLAYRARDSGSPSELAEQMRNNARLIFVVGIGSAAGLIALAGPLAHVYLGAKFQVDAHALIAISALIVVISAFRANYFDQVFEIALDTRPMAIITGMRIAVTVVFSVFLISRFSSIGAAASLLISEIVGISVTVVWAWRVMPIPLPLLSFAKTGLAAAAMVGVIELIPGRDSLGGLCATILVGMLVYFTALVALHVQQVRALADIARVRFFSARIGS